MTLFVHVDEQYYHRYAHEPVVELDQYIFRALDGESHDSGALEAVDAMTNNTRRMLARLVSKLAEQHVLKLEDVPGLLDSDDKLTWAQAPEAKKP